MAAKGHHVMGYDLDPRRMSREPQPDRETGPDGISSFNEHLMRSSITFGSLADVVSHAEILFVAVQTPHDPRYEGISRVPDERVDFDYRALKSAVESIKPHLKADTIVTVISTVLPGTMQRIVVPALPAETRFCYNPYFIAMGTTMRDFLEPEFILLGAGDPSIAAACAAFYKTITPAPSLQVRIAEAELIKVAYNTFIGMKIVFVNALMEICRKIGDADVDVVTDALKKANKRIISDAYMDGGMGDGGGCHPRDNIAMSWLARELDLSHDWFESVMIARERQAEWLVDLMCAYDLPKAVLGYAYKPKTNITLGSPALLVKALLEERGQSAVALDPYVISSGNDLSAMEPHVFIVGTRHPEFTSAKFPAGSVVIDPWRYLNVEQRDVTYVPVGNPSRRPPLAKL
jgi:UDPglucose 6-dehydrogenase